MAEPAAEGNSLLDPKRSHELLEVVPLRAIADHGKVGQIVSQEGSSRAQSKITSLTGIQAANENQLKFGVGLRDCASQRNTGDDRCRAPGQKTLCRDTRQTRHTFGTKRL